MKSVTSQVLGKIKARRRGWAFSASDFLSLGSRNAVDQALSRLQRKGEIRRIARGIYERPRAHMTLGVLSPSASEVAAAVARRSGIELQASGAAAANALGVSTQVPAKPIYLTPGSSEAVRVGNQTVEFRHVRPRWFVMPGTNVGNVFQAILYLGPNGISPAAARKLGSQLSEAEKVRLEGLLVHAPTWAHAVIREVGWHASEEPGIAA